MVEDEDMKPKRPVLQYHGGKWRLAPWIISHFASHRIYTETFGGAASVLLRKQRSYSEIYNDLDGEVVNLFRVVRDPMQGRELVRMLTLTPYARSEFDTAYLSASDPIEQARRTIVKSFMGFSSTGIAGKWKTGFRANSKQSGTIPAHDWRNYPEALERIIERLRGVVIENRPATQVMITHDSPETLHYVDPPYPSSTRQERWAGNAYRYEMSDNDHRFLAEVLHDLRGMVVISGYACDLYDNELYPGWQRVQRQTHAEGAAKRTEVLWLSPNTTQALAIQEIQPALFAR
jgi:DNA adenine methylase